jgi:hypothetical protein
MYGPYMRLVPFLPYTAVGHVGWLAWTYREVGALARRGCDALLGFLTVSLPCVSLSL